MSNSVTAARLVRHRRGVPVFGYRADPVTPPVTLLRHHETDRLGTDHRHIHEFPALLYAESVAEVWVVAAGEVIDPEGIEVPADGVALFFDPAAVGSEAAVPRPVWRTHPLLFPFLHGQAGGLLRLSLPRDRKPVWDSAIAAIEAELSTRLEGYRQAVSAHLTVLLIELVRLAADVVGDLRRSGEPLLAEVFAVIDRRHGEPLSLRDVADTVGMTSGHLTTVVRRRTGRTVQEWIIERRMAEARRLLTDTDLPIAEVARRVGMPDPGYFARVFRRAHGSAPRHWRTGHAVTA
ncbi:helix-turn-helix transcriptional regulator [Nocardia transvalensis]|uniref:helix-turn-helix transcriptional regulator n=1 Tax=Nocardia transvalensis TaxID=37333 RepID=UPI0018949B3D|nr:AraC family transcriptional regulator [Nocardia transvalensis]MBF6332821.1 helix-turn-helix transcriptional regulator [Nocardia transvalensis]